MSRFDRRVMLAISLALLASLATWWLTQHELDQVRLELHAATEANQFLKKTLGEMTAALTAKDREIERLENARCDGKGKTRRIPVKPNRSKASDPDTVLDGNGQQGSGTLDPARRKQRKVGSV